MADVFTLGGVTLDLDAAEAVPVRFAERFGAIPTLTLQRRGIPLPGLPDPWIGATLTWSHDGTLYFAGDVVSVSPHFDDAIGWVLSYQCLGLRNRLDWFPHTDSQTGVDTSVYNATPEDAVYYDPARAGRSVGQILADVLTMPANAATAGALGIGNYAPSGGAYALPAVTANDLAALTVIPPRPVYVTGEKFGDAIAGLVEQYAPNYWFWIDPDGNYRFLDKRTASVNTLTLGTDPVEPTELARDAGDSFQRVVVRGQPIAVMALLKLSLGQITEDFAWGGYTTAQAKANWTEGQFNTPGAALDQGSCTCPSTTTIAVTSSSGSTSWGAGYWDQSHQQGTISLYSSTVVDYTQIWSARVVACTPLAAGGTSTITIDNPLPHTSFDHYTITGLATGGSVVWTQYQIANTALWPRVTNQSTYPQPIINGTGGATLASTPIGIIFRSDGATFPLAFTYRYSDGTIHFISPTYTIANDAAPPDVWAYIPINTNPLQAISPADDVHGDPQYSGTSSTMEGFRNTLVVTLDQWRDPGQLAQVLAYAADLLDSVKDTVVEGSVVYYGWYGTALTCGNALQVAGDDGAGSYTTGWESIAGLCIVAVEVEWTQRAGYPYRTTMHVSTRRQHYQPEMFLRPARSWMPLGSSSDPWMGMVFARGGSHDTSGLGDGLGPGSAPAPEGSDHE
ncbi:MAG: hypothetical protein JOZ63_13345 [Planctomycetaceae bacterium]|nr:hypothetical protein [Planctomycetaceae bacterium]